MLKKVFLAIECADEKQRDEVQLVLNELSNARMVTGEMLLKAYPLYKQREGEIRQLFGLVATNGVKGLMSIQGAALLAKIAKQ